jgi:Holliday junction resolvasome RuvABC endonuclease subunit
MILCVDPSITAWGYSVFDNNGNLLETKTIRYKASAKLSKEKRWVHILSTLRVVVAKFNVDLIITERQFKGTLLQTMALCGIVAGEADIEIRYVAPLSWKKWGINNHAASKEEIQEKVSLIYPELMAESEHVCDSVGFYLAYKNNNNIGVDNGKPKSKSNGKRTNGNGNVSKGIRKKGI